MEQPNILKNVIIFSRSIIAIFTANSTYTHSRVVFSEERLLFTHPEKRRLLGDTDEFVELHGRFELPEKVGISEIGGEYRRDFPAEEREKRGERKEG